MPRRRWLVGLCSIVLFAAGLGGGAWWVRRTLVRGMASNFAPAAIAATQPAVPFDGHLDLVRGGTLRLITIGTNDPRSQHWWTLDGTPTTRPKHTDTPRDPVPRLGPAARVRELALRLDERSEADRNVLPEIDVPGMLTATTYNENPDYDVRTSLYAHTQRIVFQRPDDATTFMVRGSIDDDRWQTFAVFTPGGTKQAGPIAAAFGQTKDGHAELTLKGDWAWPMRVVMVTHAGEASEASGGFTMRTPFGRTHNARSSVFRPSDVKAAYVQLCGQQRFEIRDLPSDPGPTTRPATLSMEHLHPAVPGLAPLAVEPPSAIPARRYFQLLGAGTRPATQPQATAGSNPATGGKNE